MSIRIALKRVTTSLAALSFGPTAGLAENGLLDGWEFGAEVYFWGADLSGDTNSGASVDVGIEDIVENLKLGFMGTVAGHNGQWGVFADAIYLDVGDSASFNRSLLGVSVPVSASLDLKGFISTAGVGYRALEFGTTKIDAIGGVRFLWLDTDLDVSVAGLPFSNDSSETNWDGVIGFRGTTGITDNWYLSYYADIGTGESDLTWQALAAVNYSFERVDVAVGYRYLDWRFDDFQGLDDLALHGPFAGVKFRF